MFIVVKLLSYLLLGVGIRQDVALIEKINFVCNCKEFEPNVTAT